MGGVILSDRTEGYYVEEVVEEPAICPPCIIIIIAMLVTAPEVAKNSTGNAETDAAAIKEAEELRNQWMVTGVTLPARAEGYTVQAITKSLMAKEGGKNFTILGDKYLKQLGIDAHKLKYAWLGDKAPISRYGLYKSEIGEILILLKGGKGTPIHTG